MSTFRLSSGILRASAAILTSRILGFLREVLTASFFGAGALTDAFFLAWKIPNIFRRVLGEGALEKVFIPYLGEFNDEKFKRSVFGYLLILSTLTVALIEIFAPLLVKIFSNTDNRIFLENAILFLRILAIYLLFAFINAYFSSLLQFKGGFFKPYLSQAIFNLTVIVSVILFHKLWGIYSLIFGAVAGGLLQVLYILGIAIKEKVFVLPSFKPHKNLKRFFRDLLPSFASGGIGQLATLIEVFFATAVGTGILSSLYYAFRLYQLPVSLVGVAVSRVSLSHLSKIEDKKKQLIGLSKAVEIGLFFAIPLGLSLFLLAKPIVEVVYTHGAFTIKDATRTAIFLKLYAIGLPFAVVQSVLSNFYFIRKRFFTIFSLTLSWFLVELVLNWIGILIFHTGGWIIPFSYTVGAIITFITVCVHSSLCSLTVHSFLKLKRFFILWVITAFFLLFLEKNTDEWKTIFLSIPLGFVYLYLFYKNYGRKIKEKKI